MQLVLRVGSSFLLDTSHKPHLQKVLPCRHPCHPWDLGLGTPCDVVSPNFQALDGWDCMDRPEVTWDLGIGTPCEPPLGKFYDNGSLQMVTHTNWPFFVITDEAVEFEK